PCTESTRSFQEATILIFSPGSHQPQRFVCDRCCRTILLERTFGSRTLARTESIPAVRTASKQSFLIGGVYEDLKLIINRVNCRLQLKNILLCTLFSARATLF